MNQINTNKKPEVAILIPENVDIRHKVLLAIKNVTK